MGYRCVFGILLLFTAAGCETIDQRIDPDAPDPVGGANLRSQDIKAMADEMARDINQYGVLNSTDPDHRTTFYISSLRNDSADPIDKEIILTKLRTNLFQAFQGRVAILDRSQQGLEAIKAERDAKRDGAVTANPSKQGNVKGSDYVLKGTIKDRTLQSRNLKTAYYLVTFELTDLETGELVWTNDYEAKFATEKSVIAR
ncbi:MAG: hypothetical protein KDB80_09890 [Planctomycetes bacterium]|nr:hypothetical protein [Planctomycetota bacterium]